MSKKKSRVWTFFDDVEGEPTKVKCNQCQGIISRGGQGRKANTTSMMNHIKYKHNELMPQLAGSIKSSSNESHSSSSAQSQPEPLPPTPSPSVPTGSEVHKQQSIQESLIVQWPLQDSRAKEINIAIGEMIALDNQPLSIVENTGFINLMKKLKPKYVLPSRKYLTENIIPSIYDETKAEIRKGVLSAAALSVTTDLWTNTNNMESFLSFTAHWLNENMAFRHAVLRMKHFPISHNADNIKECLEEIPASWDIDATKIHAVVRDNGRNVAKAIDESIFKAVPCFIHTLQLAIDGALKIENVDQILKKSRRIVSHFNHSAPAQKKLGAIQDELNLPTHQLVQDVSTRWNSSYYMLSRLLEQKRSVSLYVTENTVNFDNLSTGEWKLLEKCIALLKPFEEVTKIISSSCSSISEVIPHLKTLEKYLENYIDEDQDEQFMEMKTVLEYGLKTRFENLQQNKLFSLATLLDPRYKLQFFDTENLVTVRSQFLLEALKNSMSDDDDSDSNNETNAGNSRNNTVCSETTIHRNFWGVYQEMVTRKVHNIDDEKSSSAHELHSYCSLPVIKRDEDPFKWWHHNSSRYPEMSRIAKVYLCCPASTVYSERLFSEAGNIYETKRNRLLPDRAETLTFLHHNLPLIKKGLF